MTNDNFAYEFDGSKCKSCGGKCCIGDSGYIWISNQEAVDLSKFLKMDFTDFCQKFLIKYGYKLSIKEKTYKNGFACIFFDEVKLQCSIYDFRPEQCRTFPFWDYFKKNFEELSQECCGVKLRNSNDT